MTSFEKVNESGELGLLQIQLHSERVSGAFWELFGSCQDEFDFDAREDTLTALNPAMNTLSPIPQNSTSAQADSWASSQALAILAVDGIRPSSEGLFLMQSIDAGTMTRAQAIQSIIERARLYANR